MQTIYYLQDPHSENEVILIKCVKAGQAPTFLFTVIDSILISLSEPNSLLMCLYNDINQ